MTDAYLFHKHIHAHAGFLSGGGWGAGKGGVSAGPPPSPPPPDPNPERNPDMHERPRSKCMEIVLKHQQLKPTDTIKCPCVYFGYAAITNQN